VNFARRVAAYVWASPNSAAGLALGLAALALGARAGLSGGIVEFTGGLAGRACARCAHPQGFAAVTLGHVILAVSAEALVPLRAHERVHVRQCERWGMLFVPAYLLAGLWQLLQGRCPYSANPFERQARALAAVRDRVPASGRECAAPAAAESPRAPHTTPAASCHRVMPGL
jgi:hypothetical protein